MNEPTDPCKMTDAQYEEFIYGPNRAKWPTNETPSQLESPALPAMDVTEQFKALAKRVYEAWDTDRDAKVGKLLNAMCGGGCTCKVCAPDLAIRDLEAELLSVLSRIGELEKERDEARKEAKELKWCNEVNEDERVQILQEAGVPRCPLHGGYCHPHVEGYWRGFRDRVLKAEAERDQLQARLARIEGTLRWVISDVEEWCDAVSEDSSWNGWDSHYKSFAYGGLEKAKAAL